MQGKHKIGIAAGLGVVLVAAVAGLRSFFVFGPDGPPPEDPAAYVVEPSISIVQTELEIPVPALEKALRDALINDEPVYSGTLDRIPMDVIGAMLGLPRRTTSACDTQALEDAARLCDACMKQAARAPWYAQPVETGKCAVMCAVDGIDSGVRSGGACVRDVVPVPLPTDNLDVEYDFFIARIDLVARDGPLQIAARLDSTLTGPKSVLSFFDGTRATTCGPSFTATARLRPTVSADNSDRDRPIGTLEIGFDVERVEIGRGKPCRKIEGSVQRFLDDRLGDVLGVLSDLFQENLTDTLTDMPEDMELSELMNAPLALVAAEASDPLSLAPLIEAQRPGLLPAGVTPYLSLNPREMIVGTPRITGSAGGTILLNPGLVAAPVVSLNRPAGGPPAFIEINTRRPPDDRFEVTVVGQSDLATIRTVATDQVRAAVDRVLEQISYDDLSVTLYQARERIVVGVEMSGITWLGLNARVFLTARPEVDAATRKIRLREVKFDLASAEFLSRVAAHVLESPIEATIEERIALPLGETFDAIVSEFADMSIDLGGVAGVNATLGLNLSDLALAHLWVSENTLHAAVTASGRSQVSVE